MPFKKSDLMCKNNNEWGKVSLTLFEKIAAQTYHDMMISYQYVNPLRLQISKNDQILNSLSNIGLQIIFGFK